jgi:ribonuclease E
VADSAGAAGDAGLDTEAADDEDAAGDSLGGTARRRRRKRRRGSADAQDSLTPDDPPDTVVHVREPADDVRSVKGSTRLEAKKQRRREGRESGRRRPPIVTESEFLARRESVERTMVVRQRNDRTQIAVLEDGVLVEHYVNRSSQQSYVGNVYLGKVQNVLPSMEAAFVDIGKGRNAVLYAGEVNFDVSGLEGQPKRIESALKAGQSLLVQVTKDPVGHKGARLTSQVSLPGRYLVYVPGASMTGISRKLPDTERTRLKQILKKVMPEDGGVIVRTAAEGAAEEELSRDVARLAAQWEAIEKKAKTASAPALLYSEPDLTIRVIRDVFNEDFGKLVVAGDEAWDTVDEYVRYVAPHLAGRLSRWQPEDAGEDAFAAYRIDEQLAKALERKVWLPSGGSLVIDKTEAMTVIDVNTGKFTGQGGNLEETVTRNNLEAAEEIVRQLRLRDVGGIVVIDFIDMVLESNRELVLRRLLECLARDRTKHQVAEVTSLGLVQMTRKRVGAGLLEAFSQTCECCNGRGVILTYEADADGHAIPHVHPRPVEGGTTGSGGNGHAGSGSGGAGGAGTNGSGGAGNGSGGGRAAGGSGGRTRRGSRSRGGAAGPAGAATPATVAAQVQLGDGLRVDDQPETAQPGGEGGLADPGTSDLFPAAEAAQSAASTEADAGRTGGRRRRRKPAAPAPETDSAPSAPPAEAPQVDTLQAEASGVEAPHAEAPHAEVTRPAGPPVEVTRPAGPPVEVTRPAGPPVEVTRPAGPPVEVTRPAGPPVEVTRPAGPPVEVPRVETAQADAPRAEAPQVDAPHAEAPQVEAPQADTAHAEAPNFTDEAAWPGQAG